MTQSVLPEVFRQKIAGMFTTGFRTRVTPRMRDILRAHLFPEVTVKQNSQIKIMDIQQEIWPEILVTGIVSFMVWPAPEKP